MISLFAGHAYLTVDFLEDNMGNDLILTKIHCKFCNSDGDHRLTCAVRSMFPVVAKWRGDHILSALLVDSDVEIHNKSIQYPC